MKTFRTTRLALLLLILYTTRQCNGMSENMDTSKPIAGMEGVSQTTECFGNTTQESLRFQTLNTDALERLMNMVKDQLNEVNANIESVGRQVADLHKVADPKGRLAELPQQVERYAENENKLNRTMESQDTTIKEMSACVRQYKIRQLIVEFRLRRNSTHLWNGLKTELDHNSTEYIQLLNCTRQNSPISWIGHYGYTELVSVLLDAGLLPDEIKTSYGGTMLIEATWEGHLELVKLLVLHGANVNAKTYSDGTALHAAATLGNLDFIRYLLLAGADTTARTEQDKTPCDFAKDFGYTAAVELMRSCSSLS